MHLPLDTSNRDRKVLNARPLTAIRPRLENHPSHLRLDNAHGNDPSGLALTEQLTATRGEARARGSDCLPHCAWSGATIGTEYATFQEAGDSPHPDPEPFEMETTTARRPIYVKYGEAHFSIDDTEYSLEIYQSEKAKQMEEFKEYLFLPFKDLTNGEGSYGGGRFIDLKIPEGETIIIDFNKSYNPYCAYNHKYSCPVPPYANHLNISVPAGVKGYKDH